MIVTVSILFSKVVSISKMWFKKKYSPQIGTLSPFAVTLGFKNGPQYLLFTVFWDCVQYGPEPKWKSFFQNSTNKKKLSLGQIAVVWAQ